MPTGILLNILVESSMPVIAPSGDNSKERPRLPSVNPSLDFMPGMAATQIPNKRLEQENRKPTAKMGLLFMKEIKFLIIMLKKRKMRTYGKVK